jgi:anti-sigma factor RsiW
MHDAWSDRLSEYLDDELAPGERLQLDQHLLDCARCREVLEELSAVASEARVLEDTAPARDLWPGIVSALPRPKSTGWRLSLSFPQAIAAGVLLMAVSGLGVWTWTSPPPADATAVAAVTSEPTPGATPVRLEDSRYDRAVADLTLILAERRSRLNPRTVQVIERNLATIDRAIAEAIAAVKQDPADTFLTAHLVEQRRLKLALLRQAKNLPLVTPEGN